MDTEWTANALFSPSKARAVQARAKDWAVVDAWLSRRYGSRVPNFERNEDTLQSLLTLANVNESADEQRAQIDRIEKTAAQTLSRSRGLLHDDVFSAMQAELMNETHFDTLASIVVTLDCPTTDVLQVAKKMADLSSSQFELAQQVKRTEAQLDAMKQEHTHVNKTLEQLKSDVFQPPGDVSENTAEWTKSTKQLRAKIAEYEERLNASRVFPLSDVMQTYQRRADEVGKQHTQLSSLEMDLKAFQDLPADARAARRKLEEARGHLRNLIVERDQLFQELADT